MEIKNEFVVPATPEQTWDLLLDVQRLVRCVSGAELTEIVDDGTWKGKMAVKLGPIRLSFAGEVHLEETDEVNRRVELRAKGQETRGKGSAQASVTSLLEAEEGSTKVSITTDLKLSGPVAQYGRGMMQDVSSKMVDDFARCVASQLEPALQPATDAAPAEAPPTKPQAPQAPRPVEPLKAGRLFAGALWRAFVRSLRRVFESVRRLFKRSK